MFNIEGYPYNANPMGGCPKKKNISTIGTQDLNTVFSCLHVSGFNMSLGPYVRCMECNEETDLLSKDQSSRNNFQDGYIDLKTASSTHCSGLGGVIDYLENFLGKSHDALEAVGYKGSVCPFTPKVLADQTVYFGQETINVDDPTEQERIKNKLTTFHLSQFFKTIESNISPENLKTACSLIIIHGPNDSAQCDYFVSQTQKLAQPDFVQAGLLLSELHPFSPVPSVRNQNFFPSRPPVPIFFIRRIIPNDIPYLLRRDRYDSETYAKIYIALENQFGNDIIVKQMERLGKKL